MTVRKNRDDLMKNHRRERLCDGVAFRTTPSQRQFLEKFSRECKTTICEGIRIIIDEAMAKAPANWCGRCLKPIIDDPDSDLLEILSKDSSCSCIEERDDVNDCH